MNEKKNIDKEILSLINNYAHEYLTGIRLDAGDKYLDLVDQCEEKLNYMLNNLNNAKVKSFLDSRGINLEGKSGNLESYFTSSSDGKIVVDSKNYKLNKNIFRLVHAVVDSVYVKLLSNYSAALEKSEIYNNKDNKLSKGFMRTQLFLTVADSIWKKHNSSEIKEKLQGFENGVANFDVIDYPSFDAYIRSAIDSAISMRSMEEIRTQSISDGTVTINKAD